MFARTLPMEYPTPQSITRRVACLLALAAASSSAAETPLSDLQKQWALATCAIRMSQNGDRHDILGGQEKTPANIVSARNLLHDWWNTAKREDLLESLEFLEKRGHRAQFEKLGSSSPSLSPASPEARFVLSYYRKLGKESLLGWDFTRYIALCRWGYLAGYLNEQEAWDRIMPAARLLQKTFSSWQDLGANYLLGHEFWSPGDTASVIGASLDYTYRTLVMDLNGPWRRIPWGLDLTAGAPAGSLSSSGPTDGFASVYLISRPGGLTCFLITVIDRVHTRALVDGVQKMLSCRAIRVDSDSQTGPDWVFRGDCVQPDFPNGAVIRATYPLEPFAAALHEQHVTQMAVQVGHAISANSTLSPPAKYHWFRDGEENNAQTFDLGDPAPALLLQYGYTDARQNARPLQPTPELSFAAVLPIRSRRSDTVLGVLVNLADI